MHATVARFNQGALAGDLAVKATWVAAMTSASAEASAARKQTTWSSGTAGDGVYTDRRWRSTSRPAYTHIGYFLASTGGSLVQVNEIKAGGSPAPQEFTGAGKQLCDTADRGRLTDVGVVSAVDGRVGVVSAVDGRVGVVLPPGTIRSRRCRSSPASPPPSRGPRPSSPSGRSPT